ncbi:hypothetical protein F443_19470 [Phytophthora nicotianae P1569]|uniref:Histone H2A/H2B/H3 domain-containing protein n=1 Tax=Phytophthora nicotianae P1569 TaxID=1317065 RepID=V9E4B1_PHYNI|nr:hypothetical protein F443_19470 [Phytophthora nicotianae P1569]
MSALIYEETRAVLNVFVQNLVQDAIVYTEYRDCKTVSKMDVLAKTQLFVSVIIDLKRFDLKPQQMKDRFQTYRACYLKAKAYEASTGAGITAEDESAGVYTMDQNTFDSTIEEHNGKEAPLNNADNADNALVSSNCSPPLLRAALDNSLDQFLVSPPLAQTEFLTESSSDASPISMTPNLPISATADDAVHEDPGAAPQTTRKRKAHQVPTNNSKRQAPVSSRKLELPTLNSSPPTSPGAAPRHAIAGAIKIVAKAKSTVEKRRLNFD